MEEQVDEDQLIEERRKRRQALLANLNQAGEPFLHGPIRHSLVTP